MLEVPKRTGTWISDESREICFPYNNLPLQLWENCVPHSSNGTQNILFFTRMSKPHWTHCHKCASPYTGWRKHLKAENSFSGSSTLHYDTADTTSRTLFSRKVIHVQFVYNLIHQYFFHLSTIMYRSSRTGTLQALGSFAQGPCIGSMCKQQQQTLHNYSEHLGWESSPPSVTALGSWDECMWEACSEYYWPVLQALEQKRSS